MKKLEYLTIDLIDDEGHLAEMVHVHCTRVGEAVVDWLAMHAAGEARVRAVQYRWGTLRRVDPL